MKRLLFLALMAMTTLCIHAQRPIVGEGGKYNPETRRTDFCFTASPKAKKAVLRIYKEGMGGKPIRTVKLKPEVLGKQGAVWTGSLRGDWRGSFYTFDISGDKKNWIETPGVGATAVGVNGKRGYVIDLETTNPEGWSGDRRPPLRSPADLVIYEMHHRDFSIDSSSPIQQ